MYTAYLPAVHGADSHLAALVGQTSEQPAQLTRETPALSSRSHRSTPNVLFCRPDLTCRFSGVSRQAAATSLSTSALCSPRSANMVASAARHAGLLSWQSSSDLSTA